MNEQQEPKKARTQEVLGEGIAHIIPHHCPFCKEDDEIIWTELRVVIGTTYFVDAMTAIVPSQHAPTVHIACTRCNGVIFP